ncbi:glycosyl transferases-like protein [Oleiphilus messinensis]|uniref:Glycosyl transferases-like protein n=1 Tax=Oleiphilus messinensis TaxID=141451 RepID=A0A1Y0IFT9_9GAMM|nr:glycosyltransferase family 2 protein [Oleiphilus messinensis]ARU59100.1 glycosyl transferases-like protein [Oleiphilus messinensis]
MDSQEQKRISVVAPAFNEEDSIQAFHSRLLVTVQSLPQYDWQIVYVNDGSRDGTLGVLKNIVEQDQSSSSHTVTVVDLSRNFGKEIAMTAGLDKVDADAVIVIDTDLQDPPELIPQLIEKWEEGYDAVYAKRRERYGETAIKKWTAASFYRLMARLSRVHIPRDTGDFRLLSRPALDALKQLREQHRFMKGLFNWIGFDQVAVEYDRDPRFAGESKFNYWKLWNFALEGVTSFSSLPLRMATYLGIFIAFGAFLYGALIIFKTLFWGEAVQGYPSIMVTVLLLGGVNLIFLGMIGEYLGRMFNETKGRPLYIVKQTYQSLPNRAEI